MLKENEFKIVKYVIIRNALIKKEKGLSYMGFMIPVQLAVL